MRHHRPQERQVSFSQIMEIGFMFKEINIIRRVIDPFKLNEIDPLTRSVNKKTVDVEQN